MAYLINRRAMLLAAGTVAFAAFAGYGGTQMTEIRGTVEYEGGEAIPKGRLQVYLDEPGAEQKAQGAVAQAQIDSGGDTSAIEFSFAPRAASMRASAPEIVATLERADGWLLARGSARYEPGNPVRIVLYTAMY